MLPYLRQLASGGLRVSLLTFEPTFRRSWTYDQISAEAAALKAEGITWYRLGYHKRPSLPATLYDIARGTWKILRIMRSARVNVLHARNHVPALMCAIAKRLKGGQLVFDIRGFMPEEYTDAGVWPENGYLYRGLKRVERHLFKVSDAFVLLTEKAREIVFPGCTDTDALGRPIEVIPCCVDFERFRAFEPAAREALRAELVLTGRRVIVYVGSFGGWYMIDEMTEFMAAAHKQDPTTFSMILTQTPQKDVVEKMTGLGIASKDFSVARVHPEQVPRYLNAADIAVSFIRPSYSKQSSSPTKIAEYLASGLPIVCNSGVGDLDKLIEENRAGVLLSKFTAEVYLQALLDVDSLRHEAGRGERLRAVARKEFDLAGVGRTRYRRLYQRLLKKSEVVSTENVAQHELHSRIH